MSFIVNLLIVLITLSVPMARADTLSNADVLFKFAEHSYPELFIPANPPTEAIEGYYVRHYRDSSIYLGVYGNQVHVYGPENAWVVANYGSAISYVGKLSEFVALSQSNISNAVLSSRRPQCSYYADTVFSEVVDIKRGIAFNGALEISIDGDYCVFRTNSIPNHDFNDSTASFATNVSRVQAEFRVPVRPVFASQNTSVSLQTDNAILLNGVKVDILAAACFGVGNGKIGCNDMAQPWRYDPMSPLNSFGTDRHNAHTQPDGNYHYHGNPGVLFEQTANVESPVVGFAADGFPVYGSYIEENGQVRAVASSYRLKPGARPGGAGSPGGNYDGRYVDDYEYIAGSGDLDECNGMNRNGSYGYYVINAYPWILACYKGTPDPSFNKGR